MSKGTILIQKELLVWATENFSTEWSLFRQSDIQQDPQLYLPQKVYLPLYMDNAQICQQH